LAFQPVDVGLVDPQRRIRRRLWPGGYRVGQVGPHVEQLVLDPAQHGLDRIGQLPERDRRPDRGVGLLHVRVRPQPRIGPRPPAPVRQRRRPVVPRPGVDTRQNDRLLPHLSRHTPTPSTPPPPPPPPPAPPH